MTNSFGNETNHVEDEYYGEGKDDLGDFIAYSDDDEDNVLKKQKLHHQQEEEDQEEEEENEFEEEDEEEEAPEGVQEILSLREQLKEKIRRKNAAMAAGVGGGSSSVKQTAPPANDRFGTFFGPSRQSLAPRVIQEGCSSMMKELQNTRSRDDASLVSKARPGARASLQKPKIVSEEKRKADALRENRDYSSLFSDDAEAPLAMREQPGNRSAPVPKPDGQVRGPVSPAGKNRAPNSQSQTARSLSNFGAAPSSSQGRVQNKAGSPGKGSLADRKMTVAAARNGSTAAAMKKTTGLQMPSNGQKVQKLSHQSKRPQAQHPSSQGQKLQQAPQSQRLQSNGHQQMRKHDSSAQGQRSGQTGSAEPYGRAKPAKKQLVPSSKFKTSRQMEKGAVKRKSGDGVDYALIRKELRALTGYDPSEYVGRYEDDSNMEADYASIQKEERRSAKLARQEDQEQLRLIEEERRERGKKRKKPVADARLEAAKTEPF